MFVNTDLLRRHVLESNAIEGIRVRTGALYRSHLQAAIIVAKHPKWEKAILPNQIHKKICRSTHMNFGGKYRKGCVWIVGPKTALRMPRPEHVRLLMRKWRTYAQIVERRTHRNKVEAGTAAFLLHSIFLCVHPYEDANGRSSRLILNMYRLRFGLPWLVVNAVNKGLYYQKIRRIDLIYRDYYKAMY